MSRLLGGGDKEGPTHIPAHTVRVAEKTSCHGCKHYERRTHVYGSRHCEGDTVCKHPDAMLYYEVHKPGEQIPLRTPDTGTPRLISTWGRGELGGGRSSATPDWCPFLKEKKS